MVQEVGSKSELESMAGKLETEVIQLTSDVSTLKSKFNNISNYDGINASGAANTLKSNLTNLASDLEAIATSIKLYSATLNNFDVDDFQSTDLQAELNKVPSTSTPPGATSNTVNTNAPSTSILLQRTILGFSINSSEYCNFLISCFAKYSLLPPSIMSVPRPAMFVAIVTAPYLPA